MSFFVKTVKRGISSLFLFSSFFIFNRAIGNRRVFCIWRNGGNDSVTNDSLSQRRKTMERRRLLRRKLFRVQAEGSPENERLSDREF